MKPPSSRALARQINMNVRLAAASLRDMLTSAGPVLLLAVGLLTAAYWWLDPQPPRTVVLATGPQGSAYAEFGKRYAQALATEGIRVQLLPTEGTIGNLRALRDGRADVAFVRGGSHEATPAPSDGKADDDEDKDETTLMSLGALFYEPVWIFYRPAALAKQQGAKQAGTSPAPALTSLNQLRGLRVNIGQRGSGVPGLTRRLLRAYGLTSSDLVVSELPQEAASQALQAGELDVAMMVSAPETPAIQHLLRQPGIVLAELPQADALTRLHPFLKTVTLPRGMVDVAQDQPPEDVDLLTATTALLTREDTHPALRQLFAQAAQQIHGGSGWFHGARDFPNTRTSELPVSPEGDRAINGTPPFWQRYLPFWASNLLERMWLVIGGLIVLLLPLSRVVPPLYTYRVRQRVFRWYARLRQVEMSMEEGDADATALLDELDELDRVAAQITVPLAHADELYALRHNIERTRRKLLAARPGGAEGVSAA